MSKETPPVRSRLLKDKKEGALHHNINNLTLNDPDGGVEEHQDSKDTELIAITDGMVFSDKNVNITDDLKEQLSGDLSCPAGDYFNHKHVHVPVFIPFKHNVTLSSRPQHDTAKSKRPVFYHRCQDNQSSLKKNDNTGLNRNTSRNANVIKGESDLLLSLQSSDLSTDGASYSPVSLPVGQCIASPVSGSTDNEADPGPRHPRQELSMDGPQCDSSVSSPESQTGSLSSSTSPMSTSSASLTSTSTEGGMYDFVILHTDNDLDAVHTFRDHLYTDAAHHNITVDLFSEIDFGKSDFQSLRTLHEKYRYILLFVTEYLTDNNHCRFLNEILITTGLREGGDKAYRVVPVFTRRDDCKIYELSILGGLAYHRRESQALKSSYIRTLNNLICSARRTFPV